MKDSHIASVIAFAHAVAVVFGHDGAWNRAFGMLAVFTALVCHAIEREREE